MNIFDWNESVMDAYSRKILRLPSTTSLESFIELRDNRRPILKKKKVSIAVSNIVKKFSNQPQLSNIIYNIVRKELLLQLYITNFIKTFVANSINVQANILTKALHFIKNSIGKISIQTFVNRSTKQSIKLLPAF